MNEIEFMETVQAFYQARLNEGTNSIKAKKLTEQFRSSLIVGLAKRAWDKLQEEKH